MRTVMLAVAAAVTLVLAAPAAAKELVKAELCGPAGCAAVDTDDLRLVPLEGDELAPPPPLGAYYNLRLTAQEGPDTDDLYTWTIWYLPAPRLIAFRNESDSVTFHPVNAAWAAYMKELATSVRPFSAPRITGATVGGEPVSGDPSTYARLFTAESVGPARFEGTDWVQIALDSARPTPWTTGYAASFSPDSRVLQMGPRWIRLDAGLADDLENARALGGGSGSAVLPWMMLAALLVTLALLAALGAWLRRRPEARPAAARPTVA